MHRFLVDEDQPRSLAPRPRAEGFVVEDVRDVGLRRAPDRLVFARSIEQHAALITSDLGFTDPGRHTVTHYGIILVRCPNEISAEARIRVVVDVVWRLKDVDLTASVVIVEPGRVRVRPAR